MIELFYNFFHIQVYVEPDSSLGVEFYTSECSWGGEGITTYLEQHVDL